MKTYTIGTVEVFCDTVCQEQLAQVMCLNSCDISGQCVNQIKISSGAFKYHRLSYDSRVRSKPASHSILTTLLSTIVDAAASAAVAAIKAYTTNHVRMYIYRKQSYSYAFT